jgi:taurine dioxygenase
MALAAADGTFSALVLPLAAPVTAPADLASTDRSHAMTTTLDTTDPGTTDPGTTRPGDLTDGRSGDLDVRPLSGTIGAEIRGVDLSGPLDAATVGALRDLWLQHKVVFFPDQHLSPTEQSTFARQFGELTRAHPVIPGPLDDHPELLVLDSAITRASSEYGSARSRPRSDGWHSDVTFVATPPDGSVLAGQLIPEAGGDTLWADTQAAYASLSEPLRSLVDGLTAVHDGNRTFGGFLAKGFTVEWDDATLDHLEPVEHPVVRTHPETGQRALFVNPGFTSHLVGLSRHESDSLLRLLYEHTTSPEHVVRYKWRPGDVAFWDNRTTQHYATQDYGEAHRIMHRVTLRGTRPY